MSSITRLWRRAPAWRFLLIAALAFTGLAAMFPPGWLRLPAHHDTSTRFVPQLNATPPDQGEVQSMPFGDGYSGVIPFSGHLLPLPAGTWQELALAQSGGSFGLQIEVFSRVEDQHLTGLMLAASPNPLNSARSGLGSNEPCVSQDVIAHGRIPIPGADPLARECWDLSVVELNGADSRIGKNQVMHRGLERLQEMGVSVPDKLLALGYLRTDDSGWLSTFLFLPDRRGDGIHRLEAWVRRFVPLLHKGYETTLTPADLAPVARDPV